MSFRVNKNLKDAIAKQFVDGWSICYLADLYGLKQERVEEVLRERMKALDPLAESK